jgi:SM-20-related protein
VAPRAGTLVCFLSERIPHEVLAAHVDRISIAGWFRRNEGSVPWSAPSL